MMIIIFVCYLGQTARKMLKSVDRHCFDTFLNFHILNTVK